jgi:hypothetical protein
MRFKVQYILYIGMLGMPLVLAVDVLAQAAHSSAVPALDAVLAIIAIAFGATGFWEVFLHGR